MNQVQEYTAASPPPPLLLSPTPDGLGLPPPPRLKPTLDLLPLAFTRGLDKDDSTVPTGALFNVAQLHNSGSSCPPTPTTPTSPDSSAPPPMPHVGTRSQCSLQPYLLANRYLITRSLDSSTSEAVHLPSRTSLIVKCLPTRTAKAVCTQHALLGEADGIRPPLELIEGSDSLSWLVIAPHFGDLHSYVRTRKRIREVEAQRLFGQVARVVEQCHNAGMVLRDLKLRKFVFTDVNRQSISLESLEDSVVSGSEDTLEDKHGCPAYVAPEILRAAAYSGRAADMWSLGVMLFTMIVGRYPFHGCDTNALFLKIRAGDYLVPDWVGSRARHLINLLLQKDPTMRPSASNVLRHPWLTRPPRDLSLRDPTDQCVPQGLGNGVPQRGSGVSSVAVLSRSYAVPVYLGL